jgi:hypothetical protein
MQFNYGRSTNFNFKVKTKCKQDILFKCKTIFKMTSEFPEDALWHYNSKDGEIVFRITNGKKGIENLKNRFRFGCLRSTPVERYKCDECNNRYEYQIIPQFSKQTGRCWWTSLIMCLTYSIYIRNIFMSKLKLLLPELSEEMNKIISGDHQRTLEYSEKIRKSFYEQWGIGDSPSTHPLLEGKNGMNEMAKILDKLDIPIVILVWTGSAFHIMNLTPPKSDPQILIVHVMRERWIPAQKLKIESIPVINDPCGEWYLQSLLIGNEEAGHQIGMSTCDGKVEEWVVGDSDAALLGIVSMWISCNRQEWIYNIGKLLPILSKNSLISFDPLNYSQECVNSNQKCEIPGKTNTDWIYVKSSIMKP